MENIVQQNMAQLTDVILRMNAMLDNVENRILNLEARLNALETPSAKIQDSPDAFTQTPKLRL